MLSTRAEMPTPLEYTDFHKQLSTLSREQFEIMCAVIYENIVAQVCPLLRP